MFRLTREVRFAVNSDAASASGQSGNGHGGIPALAGAGQFFSLRITTAGELDSASNYLLNIKQVDRAVRDCAVPIIEAAIAAGAFGGGCGVAGLIYDELCDAWRPVTLWSLSLLMSPFLHIAVHANEVPMVRLSQKFEFSASHRLFNPKISESENLRLFGKCSNPYGHGHNYELQVTLRGRPRADGVLIDVPRFERIVAETIIDRFDHRNLNVEIEEFKTLIPSVENIARVIYGLLKPRFVEHQVELAGVTVWETPKTWCEYSQ